MSRAPAISAETTETSPQERLLDAGAELFSQTGYEATSVRDITTKAGTNLNALNYYFGGKQKFYLEVLRREMRIDREKRMAHTSPFADPGPTAPPEKRLGILIHRLLATFIDPNSKLPRLSALEVISPSPVFGELSPLIHQGEQQLLQGIVNDIIAKHAKRVDASLVQRCVRSVLSQCTHFMFMRQVLPIVEPSLVKDPAAVAELAEHVTAFSLAAISALCTSKT